MDYRQARHILDRLPSRDVKPGLDRTYRLLDALGHPEAAVPAIHVAGTNGKGSVAAMLSGILERAGFHVGRYTSPELVDFRDRICVDGAFIPEDALAAGVEAILPVLQATGDTPTLFEALTAVGLWHFAREHVDLAVVEVGLGGRFDATNAVRPILSILTTVGRDHLALLGDTIERIAWEKAGIAKPGVPFLAGALCPAAMNVVQTACSGVGAPLLLADSVPLKRVAFDWDGASYTVTAAGFPERIALSLLGGFQAENLRLVLRAVELLRKSGLAIAAPAIEEGLAGARWPGRFEVVARAPIVVLDGAHNLPAAQALVAAIEETVPRRENRHLLFGILADKEVEPVCRALLSAFSTATLTASSSPRALPVDVLAQTVRDLGIAARSTPDVREGVRASRALLRPDDVLVVAGSLTVVAEARPCFVEAACRI